MNPFLYSAGGDIGGDIYPSTIGDVLSAGGKFSPLSYPGLQLWLDPYDTTTMTIQPASIIKKAATQTYAVPVSSTNAFDFNNAGTSQFCISMWVYREINALNDEGLIGNIGSSKGYSISWAANSTNELETDIVPSTGSFAFNIFSGISGMTPGNWFHFFWNYDGSFHGDDTQVLFIAINGIRVATAAGSQLGQLVKAVGNGGSFTIGSGASGVSGDFRFMDIAVYNHSAGGNGAGITAVQAACTAMWNNGYGTVQATLPIGMTDPLAYYPCGDSVASAILTDTSGNGHNMVATATVTPPAQMVWAWKDKSPNGFLFQAADGATQGIAYNGIFQLLRNRLCRYYSTGVGAYTTPCVVQETGNAGLYTYATNWCGNNTTGQIFLTIGETGLAIAETFELCTGNDNVLVTHHELFMTGVEGPNNIPTTGIYGPCLRVSDGTIARDFGDLLNVSGPVTGPYAVIPGNTYYPNDGSKQYRLYGNTGNTGGQGATLGSWEMVINSAQQVGNINSNTQWNGWMSTFMTVVPRSYIALGAFYTYRSDSGSIYERDTVTGCTQIWGDTVTYSPCLNPSQSTNILAWQTTR